MIKLTKLFYIIAVMLVFPFFMTTCGEEEDLINEYEYIFEVTSGRLTITNIDPKYEGKYLLALVMVLFKVTVMDLTLEIIFHLMLFLLMVIKTLQGWILAVRLLVVA